MYAIWIYSNAYQIGPSPHHHCDFYRFQSCPHWNIHLITWVRWLCPIFLQPVSSILASFRIVCQKKNPICNWTTKVSVIPFVCPTQGADMRLCRSSSLPTLYRKETIHPRRCCWLPSFIICFGFFMVVVVFLCAVAEKFSFNGDFDTTLVLFKRLYIYLLRRIFRALSLNKVKESSFLLTITSCAVGFGFVWLIGMSIVWQYLTYYLLKDSLILYVFNKKNGNQ